jgi:hypothetical protein
MQVVIFSFCELIETDSNVTSSHGNFRVFSFSPLNAAVCEKTELGICCALRLDSNNVTSCIRGEVKAELIGRPQIVFLGSVDATHNVW